MRSANSHVKTPVDTAHLRLRAPEKKVLEAAMRWARIRNEPPSVAMILLAETDIALYKAVRILADYYTCWQETPVRSKSPRKKTKVRR